jgi:hypothetical protein
VGSRGGRGGYRQRPCARPEMTSQEQTGCVARERGNIDSGTAALRRPPRFSPRISAAAVVSLSEPSANRRRIPGSRRPVYARCVRYPPTHDIHTRSFTHTHTHSHTQTYKHTHTHTYTHTHIHTHTLAHIRHIHTHTHTHTHTYIHIKPHSHIRTKTYKHTHNVNDTHLHDVRYTIISYVLCNI